jgi:Ca2+-binding RTX toxin-like protein
MSGGAGDDEVTGGFGKDRLDGGPGDDVLSPGFGSRGEIVDCGPENDLAVLGPGDRPRNCERIRR